MSITGTTALSAIVADPIAHVRAPEAFNALFAERGIDAVLVPVHVRPDGLARAFDGFRAMENLKGIVITVPHKPQAARLCDATSEQARLIGAVNAVRRVDGRLEGEMFDGRGFVEGLRGQGLEPRGRRTLLVGAGGAGSAIAFALAEAGVGRLAIANRTASKAERLAAAVRELHPELDIGVAAPDPAGFDLVVNATSLGMQDGDPLPVDTDRLSPDTLVAEVIMKPEITPLLEAARARHCRIHLGRHMLEAQLDLIAGYLGF